MHVPAVDANGEGILTSATVVVQAGSGEEYVNIIPFFSIETQQSSKGAIAAATDLAGVDRNKFDYFTKIVANAEVVDGPSGGAALGILTYAELTNKKIRSDFTATGTITPDGGIGKVGGVFKKAEAAAKAGVKVMAVPPEQSMQDGIDLATYAPTTWGMQVIEVKKLADLTKIAFTLEGSKVAQPENKQLPLVLEKLNQTTGLTGFKKLAAKKLAEAKSAIGGLSKNNPNAAIINSSLKDLNTSAYQLEQGYYYSSANNAFIAIVGVQAYSLANASKQESLNKLSQLEANARSLNFTPKTTANFEWAFAAQLRKHWALQRLQEAKDKAATETDPSLIAQSLAAAQNWVSSAPEFDSIAAGILGGQPLQESKLRSAAEKAIAKAANDSASSPDSEGAFHLSTARRAFSQGEYLTAWVDAVFADSFAKAVKQNADKTTNQAVAEMRNSSFYYQLKSSWAQLYFSHALYSKAEWERSGDANALVNALKLQELSLAIEQLVSKDVPTELAIQAGTQPGLGAGENSSGSGKMTENETNSGEQKKFDITIVTLPKKEAGLDSRYLIAGALIALVVSITALLYTIQSKRDEFTRTPQTRALEAQRKLDQLDEMLLEGKIGERNYERLKEKYAYQLKQARLGASLQAIVQKARKPFARKGR